MEVTQAYESQGTTRLTESDYGMPEEEHDSEEGADLVWIEDEIARLH